MQEAIDRANAEFWDELCGTTMAAALGIRDRSAASLRRFDQAYFDFYPYLLPLVDPARMAARSVLEIGLGYGTLGQRLAEAGAEYYGLDIAAKPVDMMNHRLRLLGLPATARRGSALHMPFADGSFDFVVSIGCFHHTGDTQRCLDETFRVLRPGGTAVVMVYNQFAFRRWLRRPLATSRALLGALLPGAMASGVDAGVRREYDADLHGTACPETAFHSARQLRRRLGRFEEVRVRRRNFDPVAVRGRVLVPRAWLLGWPSRLLGLDLYAEARKGTESHAAQRAA